MKYYIAFLLTVIAVCQCGSLAFQLYSTAYHLEAKAIMSELLDKQIRDLQFQNKMLSK